MSDWYKKSIMEEFYALFTAVSVMSYFIVSKDFRGWAILSKWALIFIVVTGIMTVYATSIIPTVARQSAAGFEGLPEMEDLYHRSGSGGYGFGQALCTLFPILIYFIKFGKQTVFPRHLLFVFVIFLFFVVLRIQAFGNIIVATLIIIISFLGVRRIRVSIALIAFVLVFAIVVPKQIYSTLLINVSQSFDENSENYRKLNDMSIFIIDPDLDKTTSTGSRVERYPWLLEAFARRPFFGDASYDSVLDEKVSAGAHLHWMSRLAVWGILGFVFYLSILWVVFKQALLLFERQFAFYYALSLSAYFILGLLKTLAGRESFMLLFVVIPGLYYLQFSHFNKSNLQYLNSRERNRDITVSRTSNPSKQTD